MIRENNITLDGCDFEELNLDERFHAFDRNGVIVFQGKVLGLSSVSISSADGLVGSVASGTLPVEYQKVNISLPVAAGKRYTVNLGYKTLVDFCRFYPVK